MPTQTRTRNESGKDDSNPCQRHFSKALHSAWSLASRYNDQQSKAYKAQYDKSALPPLAIKVVTSHHALEDPQAYPAIRGRPRQCRTGSTIFRLVIGLLPTNQTVSVYPH
ncbi:hypothetical protein Q1695_012407 [Nippostrongylus brasiliensis]|nr:hypothetical protein Q1695_012407 [Nippostrongylus brasiliensis]